MRFVRHTGMPHWGLGVVLAERPCAVDILFEEAGYKRLTPRFPQLVGVADADVSPHHPLRERTRAATRARAPRAKRR